MDIGWGLSLKGLKKNMGIKYIDTYCVGKE